MLTVEEAFRKFKSRLELNDREQQNASKRHTEVREHIRSRFSIDRDFLTGCRWPATGSGRSNPTAPRGIESTGKTERGAMLD